MHLRAYVFILYAIAYLVKYIFMHLNIILFTCNYVSVKIKSLKGGLKMGIGANFGKYLKENHIRVSDVSRRSGVNKQTIYSFIKRDSDRIDINTFIKICDAIGVKPEMFGEHQQIDYALNLEEQIVIECYRKLNEGQKDLVKRMLSYSEMGAKYMNQIKDNKGD